jgi:phenylacetate-coenzyme A ligase PaaK-like adenylate-forming protein
MLHEREHNIEQALQSADKAREEIQKLHESNERILQEARAEREKIFRELGSYRPFAPMRPYDKDYFEAWKPLGALVQIAPSNALSVAPMSVIESLMGGNVVILKNSPRNGLFAQALIRQLVENDPTGILKDYIYIFEISSKEEAKMQIVYDVADGISFWGSTEAAKAIRDKVPTGVRFIEWGHKISFGYVTAAMIDHAEVAEAYADEVCLMEQQACSSPQTILVEGTKEETDRFAKHLFNALAKKSPSYTGREPSLYEAAEITTVVHLHKAEEVAGNGKVLEGENFRVLVDYSGGLSPSPLYRTIWVKPVQRAAIVPVLRPLSAYLQTCGLACLLTEVYDISDRLVRAGVIRITQAGKQLQGYIGEPHDAVYALQRYCKRVSYQLGNLLPDMVDMSSMAPCKFVSHQGIPLLTKEGFQQLSEDPAAKQVLKSGGSSGKPKLAYYSWEDFDANMHACADYLYCCGLRPTDRVINLFSAGELYGGFVCFFEVFKHFGCVHFGVAEQTDLEYIARTIVNMRVDTVFSFPGYIRRLFREHGDLLKRYGGVKKIFYGGEHLTPEQRQWFTDEFGIELCCSFLYGSNDALTTAGACRSCLPGEFHVVTHLNDVEILKMDSDEPVAPRETGRIIITRKTIKDRPLMRYEIGDLGEWVTEPCACGQKTPKLKLSGRYGDVMRIGTHTLNYRIICRILREKAGYTGDSQAILETSSQKDIITWRMDRSFAAREADLMDILLSNSPELHYMVKEFDVLEWKFDFVAPNGFELASTTKKLREVIDLRQK